MSNVRSLRYKTDELAAVLEANNIDVSCITETWLDSNIPTEAVDINEYTCYRHDRSDGRTGGGVACYVSVHWPCSRLHEMETPDFETIWLLLRRPVMPRLVSHIVIGVIYHPPSAPSGPMVHHIINTIDAISSLHPYAGILILGDFNSMDDRLLRSYPLKQIVQVPTRGQACLDKIYTNIAEWFRPPFTVPNIASSDHRGVVLLQSTETNLPKSDSDIFITRCISTNGKNLLAHALTNFDWSVLATIKDINSKVAYFNNCVTILLNCFLPFQVVKRRRNDKPWITDKFRRLIRCRQRAWVSGNQSLYNRLRNQVNRLSKQLRTQFYHERIIGLRASSPHDWWRETKRLTGQQAKPQLQSMINETAGGDIQLFAELINSSLHQVSCDLSPLPNECLYESTDVPPEFTIHPEEVYNALSRINSHKSPGPDDIPNWFLKDFAFVIADPVCHIFNASISSGLVPDLWKRANVVPIPKSHPPQSIQDDLRPISLTPTLSKLLEATLGRRLLPKIAGNLDPRQFGALRGRSTTHALIAITHQWYQALDDRNSIRAVFIDFRKAFDRIDHSTILTRMAALGIHQSAIRWMHSFLSNRQQRVKIGPVFSEWKFLTGGMPQGTWFGPYAFIIMIDSLRTINDTYKFVDDVTLTEVITPSADSQMQLAVNQVVAWSQSNFMNINTKKPRKCCWAQLPLIH
jgi:hypothetical protein